VLCCAVLIPTELVKLIECRTDLPSVLGSWVNVPQAVEQRGIFGTQFALQFIYVLGQLFNLLGVLLPTSLGELHTEISNFAIRLNLEFVAADDFENVLCVRFNFAVSGC
jgi:hypothetical protein